MHWEVIIPSLLNTLQAAVWCLCLHGWFLEEPWLLVGSRIDPAGAFGMLHPADSTSLLALAGTDPPRQGPLAEIKG